MYPIRMRRRRPLGRVIGAEVKHKSENIPRIYREENGNHQGGDGGGVTKVSLAYGNGWRFS